MRRVASSFLKIVEGEGGIYFATIALPPEGDKQERIDAVSSVAACWRSAEGGAAKSSSDAGLVKVRRARRVNVLAVATQRATKKNMEGQANFEESKNIAPRIGITGGLFLKQPERLLCRLRLRRV